MLLVAFGIAPVASLPVGTVRGWSRRHVSREGVQSIGTGEQFIEQVVDHFDVTNQATYLQVSTH